MIDMGLKIILSHSSFFVNKMEWSEGNLAQPENAIKSVPLEYR